MLRKVELITYTVTWHMSQALRAELEAQPGSLLADSELC